MYNKRPESLGPTVNICPNCGKQKPANKALCSNCNTRCCPRDAHPLADSQWQCPVCRWKDDDWKPKKRNLSRSPGQVQFDNGFVKYYQCPGCKNAFSGDQLRDPGRVICPGCGQMMADGAQFRINFEEYKKYRAEFFGHGKEKTVVEPAPEVPVVNSPASSHVSSIKKASQEPRDYRYIESPVSFEISKHREHFREEMGSRRFKMPQMPGFTQLVPWLYGLGALAVLAGIGYGIWALISSGVFSGTESPKPTVVETLVVDSVQLASVTDFGARVTWHTAKPSTSQVEYGTTAALGEVTQLDTQLVTEHSIDLKNLKPETQYYYRVKSTAGEIISAPAVVGQFTTSAPPDNAPPVISDIKITNISDMDAVISWKTNEKTTGSVRFGATVNYGENVDAGKALAVDHSVKVKGLSPATSYHFTIRSVDASNNEAVSADNTFLTLEPVKTGYDIGNRAPDFTLQTIGGKSVTLSSLRGQPVVLNFWRIACPACVYELPFFEEVYKGISQQAVKPQIYTINLMDYEEHVNNLLNEYHYTFPIIMDFKGEAMYAYGLRSIPMTFFIDADGIIRRIQTGRFENADELREIINSL